MAQGRGRKNNPRRRGEQQDGAAGWAHRGGKPESVTGASPRAGEAFQAANVSFPPQVVKPSGVHLKLVLRFQDFGKAMFKPMR